MIVSVRGVLEAVGPDWVQLQLGGVTLQLSVPAAAVSQLGPVGGQAHLYTHLRIRDEQPILYGFTTTAALDLFQLLTGVSGVGPRLALALLSGLGTAHLRQAITAGDVAALVTAPGVGRRTASRIVLDLKGKVDPDDTGEVAPDFGDDSDVIAALTALGYSPNEARRAVSNLDDSQELTMEERVRLALQQFGGGA